MSLVEMLERQTKVLRARDVARLFEVTPQHIYKMAASGKIPSFRVAGAIRFDPRRKTNALRDFDTLRLRPTVRNRRTGVSGSAYRAREKAAPNTQTPSESDGM